MADELHSLHTDTARRIRELEAEIARLNEQAQRIINNSNRRQTTAAQANQAVAQAEAELKTVSRLPHEFFAEGQLDIIVQSINRCRSWINAGMTDAAIAFALVAQSQARLLALQIQDAEKQWLNLFNIYAPRAESLIQMLEQCINTPYTTPSGSFLRDQDCLNYFSSGLYGKAKDEIDQINETLLSPARSDLQAAFHNGRLPSANGLSALLRDLPKMEVRCMTAVKACDQEMYYSDERSEQARRIVFLFQNEGYPLESAGFDNENFLNPYTIIAGLANFRIRIRLVPVRRQGITASNVITIKCLDASEAQARMLAQVWQERVLKDNPSAQCIILNDKGPELIKKLHLDQPEEPLCAAQAIYRSN